MTATARTGIRTEMFTHPVLESCVGCPAYSVSFMPFDKEIRQEALDAPLLMLHI